MSDSPLRSGLDAGRDRYSRQTLFAGIGPEGQRRLANASVAIIGCGAMGSALANNLARAGVGSLRIIDRDFVEVNNLQRQTLFDEEDAASSAPKAIAAARRLRAVNSDIVVEPVVSDFTADNALELLEGVDLALDGTDNFEARYLLNDASLKLGIPWIYSGVIAAYGVSMTILPHQSACLRCAFPERPLPGTTPTCDTAGILNGIVAAIGGVSSTEALKLLVGSDRLARGLYWMDLWENIAERIELPRQEDCPACGLGEYEYLDVALSEETATLCGRNAVQVRPPNRSGTIDLAELARRLAPLGEVATNDYLLRARLDGYEVTVFPDARAIIKGTDEPSVARTVYARYIGS
ncbi:MAG TPA: ThiF family adenylyltransferase [Ktedonobacterales bacterium]|nr:ThiF family adenylyltransferase [Ktedonobacterales bacterium]